MNLRVSITRILLLGTCLLLAGQGCMSITAGVSFEDSRRLQAHPETPRELVPVAKVNETLYGLNILGAPARSIDPTRLREDYLEDQGNYIVNWQNIEGNIALPYLSFLFTVPYSVVVFDVVRVAD